MALRIVLASVIISVMVAARPSGATVSKRTHAWPFVSQSSATQPPAPSQPGDADAGDRADHDGDLDLYGNDVTDAVAKYKRDSDGSLYEAHSPQTQIARLGSPKS